MGPQNLSPGFCASQASKRVMASTARCSPFDSSGWVIEGGAHWTLDDATGVLNLFGHSQAYGPADLPKLTQELAGTGAFPVVASSGGPLASTGPENQEPAARYSERAVCRPCFAKLRLRNPGRAQPCDGRIAAQQLALGHASQPPGNSAACPHVGPGFSAFPLGRSGLARFSQCTW